MSLKESSTKKIAAAACAAGVLLFGAACSSTVNGSATYSGEGKQDDKSSSKSDDDESSSKSDDDESSSSDDDETSTSESDSSGASNADAVPAPDQPFQYQNGVSVTLSAPVEDNTLEGMLSDEVGRVVNVTVDNPSDQTIDMTNYRYDSSVECPSSSFESQYILNKSNPDTGPAQIATGTSGTYHLEIAVKQDAVGTECLVNIVFEVPDASGSVDPAAFTMTF